jgi:hypothetical protein
MKTRHFAQLVALSALWGASFMLIRIASPVLGPNVLALMRVCAATITLAILMRLLRHRWPHSHWRELAGLGLLSVAMPFLLFSWAALHLPAGLQRPAQLHCRGLWHFCVSLVEGRYPDQTQIAGLPLRLRWCCPHCEFGARQALV